MLRQDDVQSTTAHQEGLRERPSEVPATATNLRLRTTPERIVETVLIPPGSDGRPGEDEKEDA
jgi:hypothetical protein